MSMPPSEIVNQLDQVATALELGDLEVAHHLLDRTRRALAPPRPTAGRNLRLVGGLTLTERERATLQHLPDGSLSQKDIARELNITRNTLKTHLKSLYQKLDAHCRGEAIQRARELGLLDAPPSRPIDARGPRPHDWPRHVPSMATA